jgi:hypothetical protein
MPASIHVLITKWRIACQLKAFLGSICAPAGERRVSIPALYPKTTKARAPTSRRFFLYSLIKKRPPRSARRLMRIRYPATTVREG